VTTRPESDPASQRRRALVLTAALAVVLVAGVAVTLFLVAAGPETRIRETITGFVAATDAGDTAAMAGYLCADEAPALTEDDDIGDTGDPGAATDPPPARSEPEISAIRIDSEHGRAVADVAVAGRPPVTLLLVEEEDRWKLCNPLEQ
jgi:hypothetical protein